MDLIQLKFDTPHVRLSLVFASVRRYILSTFLSRISLKTGASFWGIASDIIGRRLAFNATLFLAGVFGLAVGGGNSWIGVCGLYAALGVGIG